MKVDEAGEFRVALLRLKDQLARSAAPPRSPRNSDLTLDRVDRALRRIDDDSYGICTGCFLIIPRGQLLMRPYTETCADCGRRKAAAAAAR